MNNHPPERYQKQGRPVESQPVKHAAGAKSAAIMLNRPVVSAEQMNRSVYTPRVGMLKIRMFEAY